MAFGAAEDTWGDPAHGAIYAKGGKYVNSGVLVIDCDIWNDLNLTERIMRFAAPKRQLRFPDQDALNWVGGDMCLLLERRWNRVVYREGVGAPQGCIADRDGEIPLSEAGILHFIGRIKPFDRRDHLEREVCRLYELYMD